MYYAAIVTDTTDTTFTSADDTVLDNTCTFVVVDTTYAALCTGTNAVLDQAVTYNCRIGSIALLHPDCTGVRTTLAVAEMAVLYRHITAHIYSRCTPCAVFCILEYQTVNHNRISGRIIVFDEQPGGQTCSVQDTFVQFQVPLTGLGIVAAHVCATTLRRDSLIIYTFGNKHRVADTYTPDCSGDSCFSVFPGFAISVVTRRRNVPVAC